MPIDAAYLRTLNPRAYGRLAGGEAVAGRRPDGRWTVVWLPDGEHEPLVIDDRAVRFPTSSAPALLRWVCAQPWAHERPG